MRTLSEISADIQALEERFDAQPWPPDPELTARYNALHEELDEAFFTKYPDQRKAKCAPANWKLE